MEHVADDARGGPAGDPDDPTQEHRALPGDPDFDPTLAPPSDPYVDDADVTMTGHDTSYDPMDGWDPSAGGYTTPGADVWSGRAEVPEPGTRPAVPDDSDWASGPEPRPAWVLPVILGVALLLLLGLLGLGLWLSLRDGKTPTTPPTTTPAATSAAPSRTPSASPTASASSSAATVALPDLKGVQYDAAVALLQGKGLVAQRVDTVNSSLPAGTVINTDPAGPVDVPAGSTVRLFVAVPPPPTTAPPSPTDSPTA